RVEDQVVAVIGDVARGRVSPPATPMPLPGQVLILALGRHDIRPGPGRELMGVHPLADLSQSIPGSLRRDGLAGYVQIPLRFGHPSPLVGPPWGHAVLGADRLALGIFPTCPLYRSSPPHPRPRHVAQADESSSSASGSSNLSWIMI